MPACLRARPRIQLATAGCEGMQPLLCSYVQRAAPRAPT